MANYITRSDIEAVFGRANVAAWSQLDNRQASANNSRIDTAIATAEAAIDDRFRGSRYAVPLSATRVVKNWAATLAGVWLYRSRGLGDDVSGRAGKLTSMEAGVHDEIDAYLSGARSLDSTASHSGPTAPVVV